MGEIFDRYLVERKLQEEYTEELRPFEAYLLERKGILQPEPEEEPVIQEPEAQAVPQQPVSPVPQEPQEPTTTTSIPPETTTSIPPTTSTPPAPEEPPAPPMPEQIPQTKIPSGAGRGFEQPGKAEMVYDIVTRTPDMLGGVFGRMWRSGDIKPSERDTFIGRLIDAGKEAEEELVEKYPESDIAKIMPSVEYSLGTAGVGIATGIGGALSSGPVGGFLSAGAGAGVAAYRASKDMFLNDLYDFARQQAGRDLKDEEWGKIQDKFEKAAVKYGLWEAIPEAIGQMAFMGIMKIPSKMVGEAAVKTISKNLLNKAPWLKNSIVQKAIGIPPKFALETAQEWGTEIPTAWGQAGLEAEAGLREKPIGWTEAAEETAKPVALQTALMYPLFAMGGRISPRKRVKEAPVSDVVDQVSEILDTSETVDDMVEQFEDVAGQSIDVSAFFEGGEADAGDVREYPGFIDEEGVLREKGEAYSGEDLQQVGEEEKKAPGYEELREDEKQMGEGIEEEIEEINKQLVEQPVEPEREMGEREQEEEEVKIEQEKEEYKEEPEAPKKPEFEDHREAAPVREIPGEGPAVPPITEKEKKKGEVLTKKQREYLIDRIDEAIKTAPSIEEIPPYAAKAGEGHKTRAQEWGTVVVEVPGDGIFTVIDNKETLQKFKKNIRDIKAKPTAAPMPTMKPTGKRAGLTEDVEFYNEYQPVKQKVQIRKYGVNLYGDGWYTNGYYAIITDEKPTLPKDTEMGTLKDEQIKTLHEGLDEAIPAEPVGVFREAHWEEGEARVEIEDTEGNIVHANVHYIDNILTEHPNATVSLNANRNKIFFTDKGKVVGVTMGMEKEDGTQTELPVQLKERAREVREEKKRPKRQYMTAPRKLEIKTKLKESTIKTIKDKFKKGITLWRGIGGKAADPGDFGQGKYYTTDRGRAKSYAGMKGEGIVQQAIKLENPLVITDKEAYDNITTPYGILQMRDEARKQQAQFAREDLEAAGYDGIVVVSERGRDLEVVVFPKTQEKLGIKRQYATLPTEQPVKEKAPTFFSKLRQVLKLQYFPKKAQSVINFFKKSGVKDAELKWMGIEQWLKDNTKPDGTIDVEKLREFAALNDVQIEEIEKLSPRYEEYTLPGGKKYRELLFTLPAKEETEGEIQEGKREEYDDLTNAIEDLNIQQVRLKQDRQFIGIALRDKIESLGLPINTELYPIKIPPRKVVLNEMQKEPGWKSTEFIAISDLYDKFDKKEDDIQRILNEMDSLRRKRGKLLKQGKGTFRSAHWQELNVLAHVRFDERTDADGNKILFIEEVQSDWHQAGKKEGYRGQHYPAEMTLGELEGLPEAERERIIEEKRKGGVPPAPFAETWHEFVMKRMLRYAAENGFDKIAWTTGEQQADRYSLRKIIEGLSWNEEDGTFYAWTKDNRTIERENIKTKEDLVELIGKAATEQLMAKEPDYLGGRRLDGIEIPIGGEGMEAFYDRLLPGFMNKYVKQWGAKVYKLSIPVDAKWETIAGAMAKGERFKEDIFASVHTVDITPSMKEDVLYKGQPKFATGELKVRVTTTTKEKQRVKDTLEKFKKGINPKIAAKIKIKEKSELSEEDQKTVADLEASGKDAYGWYEHDTNNIILISDNMTRLNDRDLAIVFAHELFGHYGLANTIGKPAEDLLKNFYVTHKDAIEAEFGGEALSSVGKAEEFLANLIAIEYAKWRPTAPEGAQFQPSKGIAGWVNRLLNIINNWLRQAGIPISLSRAEFFGMMSRISRDIYGEKTEVPAPGERPARYRKYMAIQKKPKKKSRKEENRERQRAEREEAYRRAKEQRDFEFTDPMNQPTPNPLDAPEMIDFLQTMINDPTKFPAIVSKIGRSLTKKILGDFNPRPGREEIRLIMDIFKNPKEAVKTIAHEIGHWVDYIPDKTLKRGNILGHIAALKHYMGNFLAEYKGSPLEVITEADRRWFRKEAKRMAEEGGLTQREREIKPEDVLSIWNDMEGKIKHPELYRFIQGLSSEQKKEIVKAAFKGFVPEWAMGQTYQIAPDRWKQIYERLIEEEIQKRYLYENEEMVKELRALTLWWKPFPVGLDPGYTRYRFSPEELYADAVSVVFNAPNELRQRAPKFYKAFFSYLSERPDAQRAWDEIQAILANGNQNDRLLENMDSDMSRGDRERKEISGRWEVNKGWNKWWERMKESVFLKEQPLRRYVKPKKKELLVDENPINKYHDLVYTGSEWNGYLADLSEFVFTKLADAGISYKNFRNFATLRHIMDNRKDIHGDPIASTRGITPDRAAEMLQHMQQNVVGEEAYRKMEELWDEFWRIRNRYVVDKVDNAKVFSEQTTNTIKERKTYVAVSLIKYFNKRYGDSMTPYIYKQIGSIEAWDDPVAATMLKDLAIIKMVNENEAKKTLVNFLLKYYPDEITSEVETEWTGYYRKPKKPSKNIVINDKTYSPAEMDLIVYMDRGKIKGLYIPKAIADMYARGPLDSHVITKTLENLVSIPRTLYTEINYGFYMFNILRDYTSTWKKTPGMNPFNFLPFYLRAIPKAKRGIFGYDPVVQEMRKRGMLISVANLRDIIAEEKTVERLLGRYVTKDQLRKVSHDLTDMMKSLAKGDLKEAGTYALDALKRSGRKFVDVGRTIELVPKVAGFEWMQKHRPDMPEEELREYIRARAGSPAFLIRGRDGRFWNSLFMYSNAMMRDYESTWEVLKENKAEYLFKTFAYNVAPKLILYALTVGALGADWKDWIDKVSEFDKESYNIIPLGESPNGRAVYIRIPQDEPGRLVGGVVWRIAMAAKEKDIKALSNQSFSILDYTAGQMPSISPTLKGAMDILLYLSGYNPEDTFRHINAVPEQIFKEGRFTKRSLTAFGKYLANLLGVGIIYRFPSDIPDINRTRAEKIISAPIMSNLAGRFLRMSDVGKRQLASDIITKQQQQEAWVSNELSDLIKDDIRSKIPEKNKIQRTRRIHGLWKHAIKEGITTPEETTFKEFYRKYNRMVSRGERADISAFTKATSNAQKEELLKYFSSTMGRAEFEAFVRELRESKLIGPGVKLPTKRRTGVFSYHNIPAAPP